MRLYSIAFSESELVAYLTALFLNCVWIYSCVRVPFLYSIEYSELLEGIINFLLFAY